MLFYRLLRRLVEKSKNFCQIDLYLDLLCTIIVNRTCIGGSVNNYNSREWPRFAVTADTVAFAMVDKELSVLLIERRDDPYAGRWALPGGFVDAGETSSAAAARELFEECGLNISQERFTQLASFGSPERDPRMRVVGVAYLLLLGTCEGVSAGDDAKRAVWRPLSEIKDGDLAFDHAEILATAKARLATLVTCHGAGVELLSAPFTIGDLRRVCEQALDHSFEPANFRRRVLGEQGYLEPTGAKRGGRGNGADLYSGQRKLFALPLVRVEMSVEKEEV